MGGRIGTQQRKTRYKYIKHYKERGKIPLSQYFQDLKDGDKVNLIINSSIDKGRFYPRFHGLTGTVTGRRGFCYQVTVNDGDKQKLLYVHPIHLKKQ